MSGRAWDASTEYVSPDYPRGLGWLGDDKRMADEVKICPLELKPEQKFLYLFDYGEEWRFEVQFLKRVDSEERATYPRITDGRGPSPSQYTEDEGQI